MALTRARVTLSIPNSIKTLLQDLDRIHYLVETFKKDAARVDGRRMPSSNDESMIVLGTKGRKVSKNEVWDLHNDICLPLRNELGMSSDDSSILSTLFPGECDDGDDNDDGSIETEEIKVKNETTTSAAGVIEENDVAGYFDV